MKKRMLLILLSVLLAVALVSEVEPGGPAAEAGLQGSDRQVEIQGFPIEVGGDVIVAMGLPAEQQGVLIGEVVNDSPAEEAGLRGSTTTAEISGNGEQSEVSVTLGQRPR